MNPNPINTILNTVVLTLAMAAFALLAPSGCAIVTHEETRVVETDAVPLSALVVETRNGSITVTKSNTTSSVITARLKSTSLARLEQTEVIAHRRNDGALHIFVEWPGDKALSGEGCSFDIAVPDADGLQLTTSNGSVTSHGFRGEARLKTSNGAVTIRGHDGPVSLRTSNGRVTAEDVAGPLDLRTSNGRVQATLTPDNPGPVQARSSNGAIALTLGPAFTGELAVRTSNGAIKMHDVEGMSVLSMEKRTARLRAGDGDEQSIVRTSNGSITISQTK